MRFLSMQDFVVISVGFVVIILFWFIFFRGKKHNALFEILNEKQYPLKELYGMGYSVMEMFSYQYRSKFDRQLRTHLGILYEEKYVEFYLRVVYAQSITFGLVILPLGFILYGMSQEIVMVFMGFLMSGLAIYYYMTLSQKKIEKRSEILLNDFSEIVSQLALLINAGMIMREAWSEVAYGREGVIYDEMRVACVDMENGVSEMEAIRRFGVRCIIPEIKKFSATIVQGIEKGNRELANMLGAQSDEVWNQKQQRIKRAGAKANTKLMVPMFIMFIGVLIMIIIPIFANMGV